MSLEVDLISTLRYIKNSGSVILQENSILFIGAVINYEWFVFIGLKGCYCPLSIMESNCRFLAVLYFDTFVILSSLNVLFVGSVVGLKGNAGQCVYSASKAGLEGFTRSLAKEVASRNIRVNLLAPGTVRPLRSAPALFFCHLICLFYSHSHVLACSCFQVSSAPTWPWGWRRRTGCAPSRWGDLASRRR